jgi:hypothetical protein
MVFLQLTVVWGITQCAYCDKVLRDNDTNIHSYDTKQNKDIWFCNNVCQRNYPWFQEVGPSKDFLVNHTKLIDLVDSPGPVKDVLQLCHDNRIYGSVFGDAKTRLENIDPSKDEDKNEFIKLLKEAVDSTQKGILGFHPCVQNQKKMHSLQNRNLPNSGKEKDIPENVHEAEISEECWVCQDISSVIKKAQKTRNDALIKLVDVQCSKLNTPQTPIKSLFIIIYSSLLRRFTSSNNYTKKSYYC